MKKLLTAVFSLLFAANVYAEEIQLTDYVFTDAKRMLDGYSYTARSDMYNYPQDSEARYDKVESGILKPNGTLLYNSSDYTAQYIVSERDEDVMPEKYYVFPQGESGTDFVIKEPYQPYTGSEGSKRTIINADSELVTEPKLKVYECISPRTYFFTQFDGKNRIKGLLDIKTGVEYATNGTLFYYDKENDAVAVICLVSLDPKAVMNTDKYVTAEFYKNGAKYDSYDTEELFSPGYKDDQLSYSYYKLEYKGEKFEAINAGYKIDDSYVFMDFDTKESVSDRVDKTYSFKKKTINGTDYYALFKKLDKGEKAQDFEPEEQPTEKYAEYIEKMAAENLLYNNERCFYKRGITRLDLGVVLGRAYCKATGYNIEDVDLDEKYVDVNDPYCLLLDDMGVLGSDTELYINEKELTKKEVADALERVADECGVLTDWNKIKIIKPKKKICSRELAYTETFKLYDLIMQQNDAGYEGFVPEKALKSDSDAEKMTYETATYEETSSTESTETTSENATKTERKVTRRPEPEDEYMGINKNSVILLMILLLLAAFMEAEKSYKKKNK